MRERKKKECKKVKRGRKNIGRDGENEKMMKENIKDETEERRE